MEFLSSYWRVGLWWMLGQRQYTHQGFLRAQQEWDEADRNLNIDIKNRVFMITGANSGIGLELAKSLAHRGGIVHMVVRNGEKGAQARDSIAQPKPIVASNLYLHVVDLSRPLEVQKFTKEWIEEYKVLHVLINNASIMAVQRVDTEDKIEASFATNVLGTYVLTEGLIPALTAGVVVKENGDHIEYHFTRVITVSSGGMLTETLDLSDVEWKAPHFDGTRQYAKTKRAQVALCEHWADKFVGSGIMFYSCHPGWVDTPGVHNSMPSFYESMRGKLRTVEEGADTALWLAIHPDVELTSPPVRGHNGGHFFQDREIVSKHIFGGNTGYGRALAAVLTTLLDGYVFRLAHP